MTVSDFDQNVNFRFQVKHSTSKDKFSYKAILQMNDLE